MVVIKHVDKDEIEPNDKPPPIKLNKKTRKGRDFDHYVIKSKLCTILKDENWLDLIKQKCYIVNEIWLEAYFFFNQYIITSLDKNCLTGFDYNTIERCASFVLNKQNSIKKKDDVFKELQKVYTNNYLPLGKNKITKYAKIKSIIRPFDFLSRQMIINITNHCNLNFKKFQRTYIKDVVFDYLAKLKIKKPLMITILNCIVYYTNNASDQIVIKSKKLKKYNKLKDIMPFMSETIKKMRNEIPESIKYQIYPNKLKENYVDVLKYYYHMLKELEKYKKKRFSLLPQIKLGYNYVKFDSRFISAIYDELYKKKIGIKKFEKKYKEYYKECFKFKRMLNGDKEANVISFLTNGYSVCVLYEISKNKPKDEISKKNKFKNETSKKNKPKDEISKKNKPKDEIIKKNLDNEQKGKKYKKGLYDSNECTASEEFLNEFHKIGIDVGNKVLLYCVSETGQEKIITKGYYNEKSHIRRNTKKMNKNIKENETIKNLFKELSDVGYRKTIELKKYNEYIKMVRNKWKEMWKFYGQNKVQKLELDTYINKKKAINKIVRKIIPKRGKKHKFKKKNKYVDERKCKVEKKPIMLAFGKGNGRITISNLKNNGPKGPIKKLAQTLCRYCMTILTDEYNTSKICPICMNHKLEHPEKEMIRKAIRNEKGKIIKNTKKVIKKETYRLCYCESSKKHLDVKDQGKHKLWFNRDYVGGSNIRRVMELKLTGKEMGEFERKEEGNKESQEVETSWSIDQQGAEKGIPPSESKMISVKEETKNENQPIKEHQSEPKENQTEINEDSNQRKNKPKKILVKGKTKNKTKNKTKINPDESPHL